MSIELSNMFILLLMFEFKHFLADFCFQDTYMLQKGRPGWDFIWPLSLHCLVHAVFTLAICLWFNPSLWWLSILDFVLHFLMDRFRASPKLLGRYNNLKEARFWQIFGFDQLFHHLTNYLVIWFLIISSL